MYIETIFIIVSKSSGNTERVSFEPLWLLRYDPNSQVTWQVNVDATYSGDYTWPNAAHVEAKVTSFERTGQHPLIWVNTWNHAMGEHDNNPPLENDHPYNLWEWSLNHGNRQATENAETILIYLDEGLFGSP